MSEVDPWESTSRDYDPGTYYTTASGSTWNGKRRSVAVPEWVTAKFYDVQDKRELPPEYKTFSDFVRDAMVHRLKYLTDNGFDGLAPFTNMLLGVAEAEHEKALREAEETITALLFRNFNDARNSNDREGVINTIETAKKQVTNLRSAYRRQVLHIIADGQNWLGLGRDDG